ncbi:hypothetical protein [Caulobacter sp.]|uniref:hypothetical protein n=1 Tax=Caulobacter sp. TaxID=78 RepID=UPI0031E1F130
MFYRTETINLRRGAHQLSIGCEFTQTCKRYVGSVDGAACVTSMTREGAVSALLRHVVSCAVHTGDIL